MNPKKEPPWGLRVKTTPFPKTQFRAAAGSGSEGHSRFGVLLLGEDCTGSCLGTGGKGGWGL